MVARANERIAHHSPVAYRLTVERTSYRSQMIPVTPYILVACAETFSRYPEMMRQIDAAMPAEEIGRRGRAPGSQVNTVFLWSIANFYLLGRKILTQFDPSLDDPVATDDVLDFWHRAASGFRGDGTRLAADAGGAIRVYAPEVVAEVIAALEPVDEEQLAMVRRANASLITYLFLLYFDTRVGSGDTGPYQIGDGRTLLLRDYYRMGPSDFWWSDVAEQVPYRHLLAGLAFDGVSASISDFGTSRTDPEDYLPHLSAASLLTSDGCRPGEIRPLPLGELRSVTAAVRRAQAKLYRRIAAMSRDEMIRCGAYVYFSFLRPFAEVAGVAEQLDWTVPRDLPGPFYDLLVAFGDQSDSTDLDGDSPDTYYLPIPTDSAPA